LPFRHLIVIFTLLVFTSAGWAETYVPLDDEVYFYLQRLEAEGLIQSGLLDTKPLSYREIARLVAEAERNLTGRDIIVRSIVRKLKLRFSDELLPRRFVKPVERFYLYYRYQDRETQLSSYNMEGETFAEGSNVRAGIESRIQWGWLALSLTPEYSYSSSGDLYWKRLYGVLSVAGIDLLIGKDSQWWGPGSHGALLVSDNAKPMSMIRVTNPEPVLLPWLFKYLGPFRFVFFVTKLEKNRYVPEPILWGMRFDFKPLPWFEAALERTAMLGGEGRNEDLDTWWRSLTGLGENEKTKEAGDQRAGADIKLTIPWKVQPFQLYVEAAGEDEAGGWPSKWAYLGGIYMPRLFFLQTVGLRVEYATTHVSGAPNVWYRHHIYRSGYTYHQRTIGHYMGTDSDDLYVELSFVEPQASFRSHLWYDRQRHALSSSTHQKTIEYGVRLVKDLTDVLRVEVAYSYIKSDTAVPFSSIHTITARIEGLF